jgi:hypothetical protein
MRPPVAAEFPRDSAVGVCRSYEPQRNRGPSQTSNSAYKPFYSGAQGEGGEARNELGGGVGEGRGSSRSLPLRDWFPPGHPLPSQTPAFVGQVLGHTSTRRAPGRHPDDLAARLGIIVGSGSRPPAGREAQMGPAPCSAGCHDGAGYGAQSPVLPQIARPRDPLASDRDAINRHNPSRTFLPPR